MAWMRRFLLLGIGISCLPDVEIPTVLQPKTCGDGIVEISLDEQCDPGEAGAPGCTKDCRVDCDGGVADPWRHHCYFSIPPKNSLAAAQQSCIASNGHLVTFGNANELGFVSDSVLDAAAAWIDLERFDAGAYWTSNGETGFSVNCPGCFAQPQNGMFVTGDAGGGPCLAFTRDVQGAWFTVPCSTGIFSLPVICEREAPGSALGPCDAGTCIEIGATANASIYVLRSAMSFSDALRTCMSLQGDLAVLETAEEREDLVRALAESGVKDAWIGQVTASNNIWAEGEPNGNGNAYLQIDSNYDTGLAHVDKGTVHPVMCELKSR